MRTLLASLLLALAIASTAQDKAAIAARARQHLDSLCSPGFHGRGYVKGGDSLAAEYIAAQFARIGLQPVKKDLFQPFTFSVNSFPDSMRVVLDGQRLTPGVDFIVDPKSGTAQGRYQVVHVQAADLLDPARRAMAMGVITGHASHVNWPATTNRDSLQLFASLERELMYHGPVLKKSSKLTWSVAQEALPYPLVEITGDALTDSTAWVDLSIRNTLRSRHQARNVLGMVKGKGKGYIIVGAHYDHLGRMGSDTYFPGANDNASGVAMLLSLAEHFKKKPSRYTIVFAAFAGEEAGLVGSSWCMKDRPLDWAQVRMMVNLDILGTGDEGITVVNATREPKAYDQLVALNATGNYLPQVKSRGPACNSDHCPFVEKGVPGIFIYTLGGSAAYHDVQDRAETLPLTKFPELFMLLRDFIGTMK
jgi:aminopeptidase YwaD